MDDAAGRLAKTIAELADSLRSLEARVAALERGSVPDGAPAPVTAASPPIPRSPAAPGPSCPGFRAELPGFMALAGRALVLLGGAYLFRALTDAHVLPAGTVSPSASSTRRSCLLPDRPGAGSGNPHLATAYAASDRRSPVPSPGRRRAASASSAPGRAWRSRAAGMLLLAEAARRGSPRRPDSPCSVSSAPASRSLSRTSPSRPSSDSFSSPEPIVSWCGRFGAGRTGLAGALAPTSWP